MTQSDGDKLFEQAYALLADGLRDYVIEKRYDGNGNAAADVFSNVKVDWKYDDDGRLRTETRDSDPTPADGSESQKRGHL